VKIYLIRVLLLVLLCLITGSFSDGGWKLFWSDEFDSTALNEQNWTVRTANPGWVNNEQQRYTAGHDLASSNIFVKNGCLVLEARKNTTSGEITSGRIEGGNKKFFQYGRMEARMRMPISKGHWPAFWMLGTTGNWPACGEIDIMEGKGRLPTWTSGSFHSSQGTPVVTASYTMPAGTGNVHDSFHVFAAEWSADSIRWYFEKTNFLTLTKTAHPGIPLSNNFYFILNTAVGGAFDGNSDNTTIFPESLVVDYVRVYKWDTSLKLDNPSSGRTPGFNMPTVINTGSSCSVVLPSSQQYSFELSSVNGKRILSRTGFGRTFMVRMESLSTGVYVAAITGAFGTMRNRLVIR
jgi:beta-glucanase (GH16 family)